MTSRSSLRAVIFDFGGTLANIVPTHQWLFLRACQEMGLVVHPHRIYDAESVGWEPYLTPLGPAHPEASVSGEAFAHFKTVLLRERLAAAGIQADPGLLWRTAARVYELDTDPDMYGLYDDVLPALDALRSRGVTMGILSNHEWELPKLVDGLGLTPYVASVVTSARVGFRKPHPRMFQRAFAELGVAPGEALMVGDSVSADIRGAEGVGMAGVFIQREPGRELPADIRVIQSLAELADFL